MKMLFPQCTVEFENFKAGNGKGKYLLVAGGRKPGTSWLPRIAHERLVVCADRGLTYCLKDNIRPDMLLGDGDSARENWVSAKVHGIPRKDYPVDKDCTDLELALSYIARQEDCAELVVSGIWGGRFDHAYSAVFTVLKYALKLACPVVMADQREMLLFCPEQQVSSVNFIKKPEVISVLPFSEDAAVTLHGAHWKLTDTAVRRNNSCYVSNRLAKNSHQVRFSVKTGLAGLYLFFSGSKA